MKEGKMRSPLPNVILLLLGVPVAFGQYDDYYNNYGDDSDSDPQYDPCHFYDYAHDENGECHHAAFPPKDTIVEEKKCCKGHKYMFYDNCDERETTDKLMCGDPNRTSTDPVHLSYAVTCPKGCTLKLLTPGKSLNI